MAKTLQYAKYAAAIALILMLLTVFQPQEGVVDLIVKLAYLGMGIIVYTGFVHIGKAENSRLMKYAAQTLIAIITIFALLYLLENTPYRMTIDKETAMALILLNIIYGAAIVGLGISLPQLEKKLGKAAAFAAVTYAITGALYAAGGILKEASLTTADIDPQIAAYTLTMAATTAIFAQAATIIFFQAADIRPRADNIP